jgi:hypothetical protein
MAHNLSRRVKDQDAAVSNTMIVVTVWEYIPPDGSAPYGVHVDQELRNAGLTCFWAGSGAASGSGSGMSLLGNTS